MIQWKENNEAIGKMLQLIEQTIWVNRGDWGQEPKEKGLALKRKKDICETRRNNIMIFAITGGSAGREVGFIFLINTKLSLENEWKGVQWDKRELKFWNSPLRK